MNGTMFGIRLKTWQNAAGSISSITYRDMVMHNVGTAVQLKAFDCQPKYCPGPLRPLNLSCCGPMAMSVIQHNADINNIALINISGSADVAGAIHCSSSSMRCRNVTMMNIAIAARISGFNCSNVRGVATNVTPKIPACIMNNLTHIALNQCSTPLRHGMGLAGNNIGSASCPTAAVCGQRCCAHAGCSAWTWVNPFNSSQEQVCYLKAAAVPEQCEPDEACTSWSRSPLPPLPPPPPPACLAGTCDRGWQKDAEGCCTRLGVFLSPPPHFTHRIDRVPDGSQRLSDRVGGPALPLGRRRCFERGWHAGAWVLC
jgi:hypothetical protein